MRCGFSCPAGKCRGEEMVVKSSVLKELEECYREPGNQLVVLYGRTDSEKERLLSAFVQNKKHFYYRARQVAEREQRAQMGRELTARFEVMLQKYTYEEYFNRVKSGDPTKLVVVIDEFQYIAKKDPTFMEAVLKLKAHRLYPGPVMILLCSSAVSWAERELAECIGEAACRKIDRKIKFTNRIFWKWCGRCPSIRWRNVSRLTASSVVCRDTSTAGTQKRM